MNSRDMIIKVVFSLLIFSKLDKGKWFYRISI